MQEGAASIALKKLSKVKSCSLSTIVLTSFFSSKPLVCIGGEDELFTDTEELAKTSLNLRKCLETQDLSPLLGLNE